MNRRVIVGLDAVTEEKALYLARKLGPYVAGFKVTDLLDTEGVTICEKLRTYGEVMADPKLHDIPQTMKNRAEHYKGVNYLTIHTANSAEAIRTVVEALPETMILGVTILTSINDKVCDELYGENTKEKVAQLAVRAKRAGLRGIVCSACDIPFLKEVEELTDMIFFTPGIRSQDIPQHDQERTVSPGEAISYGAHRIVIGRQILEADDPVDEIKSINDEIAAQCKQ